MRATIEEQRALIIRALNGGATRETAIRTRWDISGDCTKPYTAERHVRPTGYETWSAALNRALTDPDGINENGRAWVKLRESKFVTVTRDGPIPLTLEIVTRCRECERCLQARGRLWRARAIAECGRANRTWFGTLTLNPTSRFLMRTRARKRSGARGSDLESLKAWEQFDAVHRQVSIELTLYLKRVRFKSAAPLRYLLVAEQHQSGDPHYHMLVHESDPERPIMHKVLSAEWKLGFTQWKLLPDAKQAGYVTKYLSKSRAARVRASLDYGALSDALRHRAQARACGKERPSKERGLDPLGQISPSVPMETV